MKKLKILIITSKFTRFKRDSQPPFTYDYARQLVKKSHEVCVIAPGHVKAKKHEIFDGIHVFRFDYFFPKSLQRFAYGPGIPANLKRSFLAKMQAIPFIISQILLTRWLVRRINPNIVHAHWGFPQGLAALFSGKPYFVSIFGGEVFLARKYHLVRLLDALIRKSKQSFVITTGLKKAANNFGVKSPLTIIPFGVDIEKFHPNINHSDIKHKYCNKGELMILNIGRLVEKKGHSYLLKAFSEVVRKIPECKLIIIGDGPLFEELNKQTKKLNIKDKVVFTKNLYHGDLPKFYCAADLFILPSIIDRTGNRETQGVVLLEAMACRCPVISTKTGGIPDMILDNKTGLLVPQKDSASLAKAIFKLLTDNKLANKFVSAGYKRVKEVFAWPNIIKKHDQYYRKYGDFPATK